MKKIFLTLAVFVMAICANAQTNQYFWYQGNLMMGNPIAQIDSVTFGEGEPADTLHILLPRTIIKEVHDTVYITIHDTINTCEEIVKGKFSVSATQQVYFSKGNLQYNVNTDKWRFAEHQYDTLSLITNNIIPYTDGWQDVFAWGTGNNPSLNTLSNSDFQTFTDWGTNAIDNYQANTWRTMSCEEWVYLLVSRTNAASLFGLGTIEGVPGLFIFPDDCELSQINSFNSFSTVGSTYNGQEYSWADDQDTHYLDNTLTLSQWKEFEKLGAVFLPYTEREGSGCYHSSTSLSSSWCRFVLFNNGGLNPQARYDKYNLKAVRLVQDVQ